MDDYLKTYDDEDKGVKGFIVFFIFMLILFEPIYGIISMFQMRRVFESMSIVGNIYNFLFIGFFVFIIFTCFCFYKIPKYAVKVAKSYLVFRFVFFTLSIIINFNYTLHDLNAIGVRFHQFYSVQDMVIKIILIPLAYVSIFSVSWYVFLIKSKAIKENYGSFIKK